MKVMLRLTGISATTIFLCLATLFSGTTGCNSQGFLSVEGNVVSAGRGTGNAIRNTVTTLDTLLLVASAALNSEFSVPTLVDDQNIRCQWGYEAIVSGSNTSNGPFDLVIWMNGCNGITGTTNHAGSSTYDPVSREFTGSFTESVGGNGCILSLTDLYYSFTVPLGRIDRPTSETVSGTLSATCTEPGGSANVNCDFSDGIDARYTSSFTAACSCTGAGCGS